MKHSYSRPYSRSRGGAGDSGAAALVGLVLGLRLVTLVFRVLDRHFLNVFVFLPFLACFLSVVAWGLSIAWQWIDYVWWYENIANYGLTTIAGAAIGISFVVFLGCCFFVDVFFDDTVRASGDDLTEVMSDKWKY